MTAAAVAVAQSDAGGIGVRAIELMDRWIRWTDGRTDALTDGPDERSVSRERTSI